MKKLFVFLVILGIQAVLICGGAGYFWYSVPAPGAIQPTEFEVSEGAGLSQVANEMAKIGLIRWPIAFKLYARIVAPQTSIKSGVYEFSAGALPKDILKKLLKGEVATTQFTIPEGYNMWQVADKLAQVFPQITKDRWLDEMRSPRYRAELPEGAVTVEGYLYPETYTIRRSPAASEVILAMIKMFQKNYNEAWTYEAQALNLTKHQLVTLASIIEKETGVPSERSRISGVFHNRLRLGMRLQTDPTIIYGMWARYDGRISKKDITAPSPYNTYVIDGLPPGPIANPGKDAIAAAARPMETNELYFVAIGNTGAHAFSSTLKEHNKNVYQYQIQPYRNRKKYRKQN